MAFSRRHLRRSGVRIRRTGSERGESLLQGTTLALAEGNSNTPMGVRKHARDRPDRRVTLISRLVAAHRSEEHTSELQSLMRTSYAVFCLKKKTQRKHNAQCTIQHKAHIMYRQT